MNPISIRRGKQLTHTQTELLLAGLVVWFLLALAWYVYDGISAYDADTLRYMVTTHVNRHPDNLEERISLTLRDFPRVMVFLVVFYLGLTLWNIRQKACLQMELSALTILLGVGCCSKVLYAGFYGITGEAGYIVMGCAALVIGYLVWSGMHQRLSGKAYFLMMGAIVLLVLLNLSALLRKQVTNNTFGWVTLGPVTFQPSEFLKGCLILFGGCSILINRRKAAYCVASLVICLLMVAIRDFGAAFIFAGLFVGMTHLIFDDRRLSLLLIGGGLILFMLAVSLSTTAADRMDQWGDAMIIRDEYDSRQQRDFIVAVVLGGWRGLGIERASEFFTTYAAGTDGSLAGIQAIFGLPMLLVVMGCYLVLILSCGFNHGTSPSSQPILFQIAMVITMQVLLNYGGSLDVLPFTGITSPLLSCGGSSTVTMMGLFGVMGAALRGKVDMKKPERSDF